MSSNQNLLKNWEFIENLRRKFIQESLLHFSSSTLEHAEIIDISGECENRCSAHKLIFFFNLKICVQLEISSCRAKNRAKPHRGALGASSAINSSKDFIFHDIVRYVR